MVVKALLRAWAVEHYRTALSGAVYSVLLPIGSLRLLEASPESAPPETP